MDSKRGSTYEDSGTSFGDGGSILKETAFSLIFPHPSHELKLNALPHRKMAKIEKKGSGSNDELSSIL